MEKTLDVLKIALVTLLISGLSSETLSAQTHQGPAQGTSSMGQQVMTSSFAQFPAQPATLRPRAPKHAIPLQPDPPNLRPPLAPVGFNEQDDLARLLGPAQAGASAPALIQGFAGITFTGFIPPDPIIAVGPNHVMPVVNTDFAIYDKTGTPIQQISAEAWYNNVQNPNNAFDPKIFYDHFDDRWVMVWLSGDFQTVSHILVSVSDDSDPTGTWCNWALRGDLNGSTVVQNGSDYQGLGFDEEAVYVVPNQFNFNTFGFDYVKIRILPKTTLYDTGCPAITWTDFWDLRDPDITTQVVFTVRPAHTFGTPGVEYLMNDSPFLTGTTMTVWEITNPTSPTPTLSGQNVSVNARELPPDAFQMDGAGKDSIDVGGPRIRNVVFRDNSLWTAHSVADATGQFARARYVRLDVSGASPSVLEDVAFGSDDCWLYYPAVTSDVSNNMVMVYTQSCNDSFAEVRYTARTTTDSEVQPSAVLKQGEASYEVLDGSGRNRWGDYSGVAVDPTDGSRVWIYGEYAETPGGIDQWGTWVGEVAARNLGDVDDDGDVDVGDLTVIVEIVLGIQPVPGDPLDFFAADCAANQTIDIGDIVCVVDIILSPPSAPVLASRAVPIGAVNPAALRLSRADEADAASAGVEGAAFALEAELGAGVAALEARLAYDPTRIRLKEPQLAGRAAGFQLAHADRGKELRVVLYSLEGETIEAGDGPLAIIPYEEIRPLSPAGDAGVELTSVRLSDRAGNVAQATVGTAATAWLPADFRLSEPYPNPVGTEGTRLDIDIPRGLTPALSGAGGDGTASVRVVAEVFNVRGRLVRRVMDSTLTPGRHVIEWDGRTDNGGFVSRGLYIMRVTAGPFKETRKLLVSPR